MTKLKVRDGGPHSRDGRFPLRLVPCGFCGRSAGTPPFSCLVCRTTMGAETAHVRGRPLPWQMRRAFRAQEFSEGEDASRHLRRTLGRRGESPSPALVPEDDP
jgi:hypothetical protein